MQSLTQTQVQILTHAVSRTNGSVLPLPEGSKLRGGALRSTLTALEKRNLISRRKGSKGDQYRITASGRTVIGQLRTSKGIRNPKSSSSDRKRSTKQYRIIDLLERPNGASIGALVQATGWQPHSVRAALTGLRKRGFKITRSRAPGENSVYAIVEVC